MDIANIKEFIKSGTNEQLLKEQIFGGTLVLAILGYILFFFGFDYGGIPYRCSIVGYILITFSIIFTALLLKNFTLKKKIQYNALLSMMYTIIFSLASYLFMEINQISFRLLFSFIPLIFAGISIIYSTVNLKLKTFVKKKKRKNTAFVMIGTAIGIFLSKTILDTKNMDPYTSLLALSIFILIMACISALGAWNFLKLYYIKILESKGIDIEK